MFSGLRALFGGKNSISERRRWALALGGPLAAMHSEPFDCLASHYPPPQCRKILAEWWNTTDSSSARNICEWLRSSGHTKVARDLLPDLLAPGPKEGQLRVVERNRAEIQRCGLAAWDIGRLAVVVRWSSSAGFLSEDEAWRQIETELPRVQQLYASWEEFGRAWNLGYEFWSGGNPDDQFKHASTGLLTDKNSPWKKLAWKTSLDG